MVPAKCCPGSKALSGDKFSSQEFMLDKMETEKLITLLMEPSVCWPDDASRTRNSEGTPDPSGNVQRIKISPPGPPFPAPRLQRTPACSDPTDGHVDPARTMTISFPAWPPFPTISAPVRVGASLGAVRGRAGSCGQLGWGVLFPMLCDWPGSGEACLGARQGAIGERDRGS